MHLEQPYKLLFLGTGDFGVPILENLAKDPHFQVVGVITAPDKPQGRKMVLTPTQIKVTAENLGIPVFHPTNKTEAVEKAKQLSPDICLVVAYGMILSKEFLSLPRFGCINIHGSILPKYRGASPIHQALLNGDSETGNSWQRMEYKMDTGPVIGSITTEVDKNETFFDLYKKLAQLAADKNQSVLLDYIRTGQCTPQDDRLATYCSKIDKSDGLVDFSKMKTSEIYNKFRAYIEWPNVYFKAKEMNIKIIRCIPVEQNNYSNYSAGIFINSDNKKLLVKTTDGAIELIEVQPPSKKPMSGVSFLQGYSHLLHLPTN